MKAKKKETAPEPERQPANPPMPEELIKELAGRFAGIESLLADYAVQLKAPDRRHLNGVRVRTEGFISRAFDRAVKNPNLLPVYTPFEKFKEDYHYFLNFQKLLNLCNHARETLWNITLQAAHDAYADARDFYTQARDAKKRKIPGYEEVYKELFQFYKKSKREGGAPTQKEVIRDVKGLLRGKKDGKVVIENVRPKVIKGRREVIVREQGAGNGE